MKTFPPGAALLISALFCLHTASAWDPTGHMLVDQVAYENTKPEARARVAELVAKLENKYNNHVPYNFVTAGCYMDDMRASPGYAYTKWHFIDVPYTADGSGYAEPEPPHVVWAIEQAKSTLTKNPNATDAQKAEALAMLMHFVGDIHQPLHCVDWNDQGGNGYFIAGITFSDISKKQVPNLHMLWDRAYRCDAKDGKPLELYNGLWLTERPGVPATGTIKNQAAKIILDYPASALAQEIKIIDPHAWAKESYALACKSGYPAGPHPTDYEVVTLKPDFVHQAHDIASKRVALAGYRLAALLNEIFATPDR
ncbi:MAG TPA: S1/P1 nuclease [Chthoniobacteraceae bacterium]|nr:S1/P1 nuclease [Chthoniobacteraceae bacterium]